MKLCFLIISTAIFALSANSSPAIGASYAKTEQLRAKVTGQDQNANENTPKESRTRTLRAKLALQKQSIEKKMLKRELEDVNKELDSLRLQEDHFDKLSEQIDLLSESIISNKEKLKKMHSAASTLRFNMATLNLDISQREYGEKKARELLKEIEALEKYLEESRISKEDLKDKYTLDTKQFEKKEQELKEKKGNLKRQLGILPKLVDKSTFKD